METHDNVNPYAAPSTEYVPQAPEGPTDYAAVPFYRRHAFSSAAILSHALVTVVGLFVPYVILLGVVTALGVIGVCFSAMTGPIYFHKRHDNGTLKKWGLANKVAALIFLPLFVMTYPLLLLTVFGRYM